MGKFNIISPSIFYFEESDYSKEIYFENENYKVFIKIGVKLFNYYQRESTCPSNALKKRKEKVEYRIVPENEKDIQVFSLTFV